MYDTSITSTFSHKPDEKEQITVVTYPFVVNHNNTNLCIGIVLLDKQILFFIDCAVLTRAVHAYKRPKSKNNLEIINMDKCLFYFIARTLSLQIRVTLL